MNWRCWFGHHFPWPPHDRYPAWGLWQDFDVECSRGCGARQVKRCLPDWHYTNHHPEPSR